jgi:hypothetical protein
VFGLRQRRALRWKTEERTEDFILSRGRGEACDFFWKSFVTCTVRLSDAAI